MKNLKFLLLTICFFLLSCNLNVDTPTNNHTHSYSTEWQSDETYHWHVSTCEHSNEITGKAEHIWVAGIITTEPTYINEGVKTYTCSVCNRIKTESIPKKNLGYWLKKFTMYSINNIKSLEQVYEYDYINDDYDYKRYYDTSYYTGSGEAYKTFRTSFITTDLGDRFKISTEVTDEENYGSYNYNYPLFSETITYSTSKIRTQKISATYLKSTEQILSNSSEIIDILDSDITIKIVQEDVYEYILLNEAEKKYRVNTTTTYKYYRNDEYINTATVSVYSIIYYDNDFNKLEEIYYDENGNKTTHYLIKNYSDTFIFHQPYYVYDPECSSNPYKSQDVIITDLGIVDNYRCIQLEQITVDFSDNTTTAHSLYYYEIPNL